MVHVARSPANLRNRWTLCGCALLGGVVMVSVGAQRVSAQAEPDGTATVVVGHEDTPASAAPDEGFRFGSYGRVIAGSNAVGGRGRPVSATTVGPRLLEDSYLELDLQYRLRHSNGATLDVLVTPALTDAMFHFDGDFDGSIALRNAWVGISGFGVQGLSFWAGSRMLRGDDIYLLDLWPLDNLNTVGAGADWSWQQTRVGAHVGFNQLASQYQFQEVQVPRPTFGTDGFLQLDRVRLLSSLRVEQGIPLGEITLKVVGYGDLQSLPEGTRQDGPDQETVLPAELGWTTGVQVGAWGLPGQGWANLFFRVSGGLGAYGELAEPVGLDIDRSAADARLWRAGLSFGADTEHVGVTGTVLVQRFLDADGINYDVDDVLETVAVVRAAWFATTYFHPTVEASWQRQRPDGIDPRQQRYLEPAMWQLGVLPTLTWGKGVLARPQLRAMYVLSVVNEGVRARYPVEDPRASRTLQHFIGLGAEWWFNSSSYR